MLMLTRRFQILWAVFLISVLTGVGMYTAVRIPSGGRELEPPGNSNRGVREAGQRAAAGQGVEARPAAWSGGAEGSRQEVAGQPAIDHARSQGAPVLRPEGQGQVKGPGQVQGQAKAQGQTAAQRQAGPPPALTWPLRGAVLSRHGMQFSQTMRDWRWHNGIDIQADQGSAVRAAFDGVALSAALGPEWQGEVVLEHDGGWRTRYAGCGQPKVLAGARVSKGQVVCYIGPPGLAEVAIGPHLHFEVLAPAARGEGGARQVDPLLMIGQGRASQ